jgi:hypothetical protein
VGTPDTISESYHPVYRRGTGEHGAMASELAGIGAWAEIIGRVENAGHAR